MFPSNNKLAKELSTKYPVIPNNPQDQIDALNAKLEERDAENDADVAQLAESIATLTQQFNEHKEECAT